MFISKGSYGEEELENVIALSVQETHRPLQAFQLLAFKRGRIGPTMEIWDNKGPDIPLWYRVCTKAMFISKGSYGYGELKNVITLSVQYKQGRIGPTKEILDNSGPDIPMVLCLH